MILAVLETRCGLSFSGRDVYLSVAGGLRITEPAADLAVAAALISALVDTPLPKQSVVFGEVALSGEVRPAGRSDLRLKEAAKLGFESALAPPQKKGGNGGVKVKPIAHISELATALGAME
jgi:DNA repair protein RadA/Sms